MNQQVVHLREGAIAEVEKILRAESASRLFLVVDNSAYVASGAAAALERPFSTREVTRFSDFDLNPKLDDVERGIEMFHHSKADMIIALGGGSAMDLAKLIGVLAVQNVSARDLSIGNTEITRRGPATMVIPTTSGTGSDATHFAVVYVEGKKYSLAHTNLIPKYVVIDPALTHSLPSGVTAATGLDAFCQAIESIWAVGATEESLAYAREAAQLAFHHLPSAVQHPTTESREGMCRAAHLSGKAINITKTTAPHALSYFITGQYGLAHGFAVALTLGPLLAYNAQINASDCNDPRGPEHVLARVVQIVEILKAENVTEACNKITDLLHAVNCPVSLFAAGITDHDALHRIINGVNTERLSNNPRMSTRETLHALLKERI